MHILFSVWEGNEFAPANSSVAVPGTRSWLRTQGQSFRSAEFSFVKSLGSENSTGETSKIQKMCGKFMFPTFDTPWFRI